MSKKDKEISIEEIREIIKMKTVDSVDYRIIKAKIAEAKKLIGEAVHLADKAGVPITEDLTFGECYLPQSFTDLINEWINQDIEDGDIMDELNSIGIYPDWNDGSYYSGWWLPSQNC